MKMYFYAVDEKGSYKGTLFDDVDLPIRPMVGEHYQWNSLIIGSAICKMDNLSIVEDILEVDNHDLANLICEQIKVGNLSFLLRNNSENWKKIASYCKVYETYFSISTFDNDSECILCVGLQKDEEWYEQHK